MLLLVGLSPQNLASTEVLQEGLVTHIGRKEQVEDGIVVVFMGGALLGQQGSLDE